MDKEQVDSVVAAHVQTAQVTGSALSDLLMEIVNSADITVEQGKRLFALLADTKTSEIVALLSEFVTMDTGKLITLAKSAPNVKVKCVIYFIATVKILKWVVGLVKARKDTQKS